MQSALRSLDAQKRTLEKLLASHILETEDLVNVEVGSTDSPKGKSKAIGSEQDFADRYQRAVRRFEEAWKRDTAIFDSLSLGEETALTWIDHLGLQQARDTVHDYVKCLIAGEQCDPYVLGSGIATLEGSALGNLLPTSSGFSNAPLLTLLEMINLVQGPIGALQLLLGISETAIRELVGREQTSAASWTFDNGIGLGIFSGNLPGTPSERISRSREKELEHFLVDLLDQVDALGLEHKTAGNGSIQHNPGPSLLHQGIEDILLETLDAYRHDSSHRQKPKARASARLSPSGMFNPSSWGGTVTSTISSISQLPLSGLAHVANGAAAAAGMMSPISPSSSPDTERQPPLVPEKPDSLQSCPAIGAPSSPSRIRISSSPKPLPSPIAHHLTIAAARILETMKPSASSPSTPLAQALISRLLSTSFSSSEVASDPAHRKVKLLAIARWWAFGWLGRKLGRIAYGGAQSSGRLPFGVTLDLDDCDSWSQTGKRSSALLDEVSISNEETIDVFQALHTCVYSAILEACNLKNTAAMHTAGQEQQRLQQAAKDFVTAWSTAPNHETDRENHQPNGMHTFSLSADEFAGLVDSFAPLILQYPARGPRQSSGASKDSSAPNSFRLSSAFQGRSATEEEREEKTDRQVSDEEDLTTFADWVNLVQRRARETASHFDVPATLYVWHCDDGSLTINSDGNEVKSTQRASSSMSSQQEPAHTLLSANSGLRLLRSTFDNRPAGIGTTPFRANSGELNLLAKGLVALVRGGWDRGASPATLTSVEATAEIVAAFRCARERTKAEHDYTSHILFQQCTEALHCRSQEQRAALIKQAVEPLRLNVEQARQKSRLARNRIETLNAQRDSLVEMAQEDRTSLDDIRIRFWYSTIKRGPIARQLRSVLSALHHPRASERRQKVEVDVRAWRNELGIYSFTKNSLAFEEALMLVETTVELSMHRQTLFQCPLWRRERDIISALLPIEPDHGQLRSSLVDTLLSSGSSLLMAPLHLTGIRTSTDHDIPLIADPTDVILPFGAGARSLQTSREVGTALVTAAEEYLLRLQSRLSAFLWSDVCSGLPAALLEGDSWFEDFAGPASPLRQHQGAPVAYTQSSPAPPQFVLDTVKRFVQHPSPHRKMHTLLQLELMLSGLMSQPTPQMSIGRLEDDSFQEHTIVPLLSPPPSLFATGLDESNSENTRPQWRAVLTGLTSAPSSPTRTTLSPAMKPLSLPTSPLRANFGLLPTTHKPTTTDDLISELESVLLHALPDISGLFQALQIVASLTPPAVLDRTVLGKAFWDVAGAAISIRRDVVEGKDGIVERAIVALSEGTEESHALGIRLLRIAASEESVAAQELLQSMPTPA